MKTAVIACRTLEKELLAAMKHTGCTYDILWLPAGEHNIPQRRREQIQQALDDCKDCDTILLAMSLCGGAASDLAASGPQTVIPRCDDCITVLLGSEEQRKTYLATYFLTEGWLAGKDSIWAEYRRAEEKYGKDKAKRIFSVLLANYNTLAFVDTGCADISEEVQTIAAALALEYRRIPGTCAYLETLLTGPWDDRFLVIPSKIHTVTVLPQNICLSVRHGTNLLKVLQGQNAVPEAPCGGHGTCGKCRVLVDGAEVSACQTRVTRDMTVTLPQGAAPQILHDGIAEEISFNPVKEGYLLAFDIGTTSVVCYLMDARNGALLASAGAQNPQRIYGADVISRIQSALNGDLPHLTRLIRICMTGLGEAVCQKANIDPASVGVVSAVGNPAMQQLFLGISPENLAVIPFSPVLTKAHVLPCAEYLSRFSNAQLLTPPDIAGFVGADTVACMLASGLHKEKELTLLVDIGTNGEMVLGNRNRRIACSTAAGPALEGACIQQGMRGAEGAIDHVWLEKGVVRYSVIGGGNAIGICGSGLVDAVAVMLELGLLNKRGRILNEDHIFRLSEDVILTQEDIRQLQLAKGAIRAGIDLMAKQLGISLAEIRRVELAGAFGTHLNPRNACRIGMIPRELEDRICAIGNAAGAGARMIACSENCWKSCRDIAAETVFLELADLPDFPGTFSRAMGFDP